MKVLFEHSRNIAYVLLPPLIFMLGFCFEPLINSILFMIGVIYWPLSIVFCYFDYSKIFIRYKKRVTLQQTCLRPLDMIPQIIFNQIMGIILLLFVLIPISGDRGFNRRLNGFSIHTIGIIELGKLFFVYDTFFYFAHRLIYHPFFYRLIHKQHHTTFADSVIYNLYLGLIDFMLEILLPYWFAISLCNTYFISSFIFEVIDQINGLITHSAYHPPFLSKPDDHLGHHLFFNWNYGVGGVWD